MRGTKGGNNPLALSPRITTRLVDHESFTRESFSNIVSGGLHVTVNTRFAISPLDNPVAFTSCLPKVAPRGIVT